MVKYSFYRGVPLGTRLGQFVHLGREDKPCSLELGVRSEEVR